MAKSPTTASAPEPTSSPSEEKDQGAHNLRLWRTLGKSDPRHTKPITGRGFDGTALKPMWQNMRMTEIFGPVGLGWGMSPPEFRTEIFNDTMLVYCTVRVWYLDPDTPAEPKGEWGEPGNRGEAVGVGGDVVGGKRNNGKLFTDDEAFKKAYTDALGNAFKFIGVAADIHMGMFDDSKYVDELKAEFAAAEDMLGKEIDALLEQIRSEDDLKKLVKDILPVVQAMKPKLEEAKRPGEWSMLTSTYNARKAKLTQDLHGVGPDQALAHEPKEPDDQA